MQELLEIRVLGPFEVLSGGAIADVGGSKRQALLAMLALRQGRVVDVDGLVDGLWGEELPAAPRNALHHHIARLRAALGEESIVGSPDGYALKGARVDAVRFEELLADTRSALRDGDVLAAADAVASAPGSLARVGAARTDGHGVVRRRGASARDVARRRARGGLRGQARARRASRACAAAPFGTRREPFPRAAVGAIDARALSQRPPGRCARRRSRRRGACSPTSWGSSRGRSSGGCRRRSSRMTRRSPRCRSSAGAAAICPRLRPRSSAARMTSARSPRSSASIAS